MLSLCTTFYILPGDIKNFSTLSLDNYWCYSFERAVKKIILNAHLILKTLNTPLPKQNVAEFLKFPLPTRVQCDRRSTETIGDDLVRLQFTCQCTVNIFNHSFNSICHECYIAH